MNICLWKFANTFLLHQRKNAKHTFCSKLPSFDFYALSLHQLVRDRCQCFPTSTVCVVVVGLIPLGGVRTNYLENWKQNHTQGVVCYLGQGRTTKGEKKKKSFLESFSWWTQKIQLLGEKIIKWKVVFRKMLLHQQKIAKHTFCSKLSYFDFYLLNFWSYCLSTNCSIIGVSQCFPTITVRVRCWWWVWLLSGGRRTNYL